jgi:signal transduction histidine kinase
MAFGGAGIPDADRERIFDRFVQLDPCRRQALAGLGLPIRRWRASEHGGSLRLSHSSEAGSIVVADLPLHP